MACNWEINPLPTPMIPCNRTVNLVRFPMFQIPA